MNDEIRLPKYEYRWVFDAAEINRLGSLGWRMAHTVSGVSTTIYVMEQQSFDELA